MVSEVVQSLFGLHVMLQTQKVSYVLNPLSSCATYIFTFFFFTHFPLSFDLLYSTAVYTAYGVVVMVNIAEVLDIKIGL